MKYPLALTALLLSVCEASESLAGVSKSILEMQQTELSCQLQKNSTLKSCFHSSVREQHRAFGIQPYDRYSVLRARGNGTVSCYGACPRASPMDVTWCVHLYHPTEEVKVCFNMSGVINQTPLAAQLQLDKHLAVKMECGSTNSPSGCLRVTDAPYYLNLAYLVCTSQTDDCSTTTFIVNSVDARVGNVNIAEVKSYPNLPVLGESVVLKCNASSGSSIGYIQWTRGTDTFYPIYEDPFCKSCYQDISPGSGVAKLQRIRMYIMLESYAICGAVLANFIGYLVIDNVTQADSGKYECIADTKLTAADTKVSASLELHIANAVVSEQIVENNGNFIKRGLSENEVPSQPPTFSNITAILLLLVLIMAMASVVGVAAIVMHRRKRQHKSRVDSLKPPALRRYDEMNNA